MAGVFLLALCVRGLYLYDSSDNPTFSAPIVDSLTYDQMARGLTENGELTQEFFWQPSFYPLFLSVVYWFSDGSVLWVKVLQAILGSLACVLVYRLGKELFGGPAGILAGVITAVYMPLVFFEGELLAVGWAAFWSVAAVLLLVKAAKRPTARRCFLWGLCGALSIVTRPVFVPFFAAGCVWLIVAWIRSRTGLKDSAARLMTLAGGFLIVAVPLAFLSYQVMGKPSILPYSGGINLYVGNNPNYKETITIRPGLKWRRLTELPDRQGITDPLERQRFFRNKTVEYVISEPASFLKGLGYKTAQFLSSREMPRNVDIYLFREWSGLLRAGVWKAGGFGFPFGVLFPLAVVGLVYQRRSIPAAIWLLAVLYPASVILVFVTARYRMPMIGLMAILAGAGCVTLRELLRARQWSRLGPAMVLILGAGLAGSLVGPFHAEQLDYEPELYYGLGDSLDERGLTDEGIKAYSYAVSLRPDYVEAHHNMGLLLAKRERLGEAMAHYKAALAVDPENAGVHEDLGLALSKQGNPKEAIEHYRRAIEIDPGKDSAYDNMGTAFWKLDRLPEALESYSKAIELNPNDAGSHNNIGNVFALTGRPEKAIEHYQTSLRLGPDDPESLNNLANVLATVGRFEQAVENYKRALRIAPDDAGICCNMGQCFQRQNRIAEAQEAYRRALAIEPKNQRALQALQQLSP
jgi:tetratricopeptide (TPR) repeat protein